MFPLFLKEINNFFSSLTGYLAIIVFLLVSGLFMWVFPDTSVLNYGFATLEQFFTIAPWVLLLLVPAITMRLLAEEYYTGTIELLLTRPIATWQIIAGKYLAALLVLLFALLPTLIYAYTIHKLGSPPGNIDMGMVMGSYIGLFLLGASFAAIGLFASALSRNQVVAFLLAVFLCFFFYIAFGYLSQLGIFYASLDNFIQNLGIEAHYNSISRGVIYLKDIVYFISVIILFLSLCNLILTYKKR